MQQPKNKIEVGDLVEYSDDLPFAIHSGVGVVIEILSLKDEWERLEAEESPEYAKGFLEELKMYYALRGVEQKPDVYPIERQEMFEKMLAFDEEEIAFNGAGFLVKVVWTNGESYVEHPDDLKIVLKVKEVPDGKG